MKRKINLQLAGIAILAILVTLIGVTFAYYSIFRNQVRNDLNFCAQMLKDTRYFESPDMDPASIDFSSEVGDLRITWVDSDGTVLYDNVTDAGQMENHGDRPEIQQAFATGEGEIERLSSTLNTNTFYYALLLDNNTVLRVSTEAKSIWAVFASALPVLLVLIPAIILLCLALSHILTQQLIAPIETMAKQMDDTGAQPPYKELVPFSNMIRQQHADILSAAKARQDFTANVSHELKTPLTAISGYAELMENGMVDEAQSAHFVSEIRKNADRLLSLINDIIRLSELDRKENNAGFEPLDLYDTVAEGMDALEMNAKSRNISLTFTGEHCQIIGNREMIHELTDNLVQNAIRYNNEGGFVSVEVKNADSPLLQVKDNGIGIPEEDRQRVFERFYRVDKSRSKATGGTGLGLAIVKHIVELHDAQITLTSATAAECQPGETAGTTIVVRF